jgi:hypothetical protein
MISDIIPIGIKAIAKAFCVSVLFKLQKNKIIKINSE